MVRVSRSDSVTVGAFRSRRPDGEGEEPRFRGLLPDTVPTLRLQGSRKSGTGTDPSSRRGGIGCLYSGSDR